MNATSFRSTLLLSCILVLGSTGRTQTEVYSVPGSNEEAFGYSIDVVGDVNGDGVDDFVAGAPYLGVHPFDGRAVLCSGADGATIFQWTAPVAGGQFGHTVSGAGDVDMDGVPDVLVGATRYDTFTGVAYLYSGATSGLVHTFTGSQQHALMGYAFAALGDLTDDGHDDYAIAAPGQNGVTGEVFVHSGADASVLWSVTYPTSEFVLLGGALAALDDLDGDGKCELAIGAPYAGPGNTGAAYVHSGATGALLFSDEGGPGANAGYAVAGPGDMDGDGVPDWLVGVPGGGDGLFPTVRLRSGADGSLLHTWTSAGQFNRFGEELEPAGDVNDDGVPDFWLGQPDATISPLRIWLVDGASKQYLLGVEAPETNVMALAGGHDLTGDGVPDLLEGRPLAQIYVGDGAVVLWSVGCSSDPFESYCLTSPNSAGAGALMDHSGSSSVSTNNLRLETTGCPPGQPGLYFYGANAAQLPFGDGFRCVSSPIYRLNPPVTTGTGAASKLLDLENLPGSAAPILAGSLWRFQLWYRDPGFGFSGFNLSDGLAVGFCP